MADLSPAAQVVWHAYETADCDPYEIDPRRASLAAALRAAADQVVPVDRGSRRQMNIRADLLTLATELESHQ